MEVARAGEMGPERILPNPEEDALQDRPSDTAAPEEWSGEEEEGGAGDEDQGSAGYYYQPLNQDPDGMSGSHTEPADEGTTAEQLQDVQDRIEAMGLFLPQPPPPDSDEEEDPEGAAACRSSASIPMDADHVELVKRTMAAVNLPTLGIPAWAQEISDDQWKDMVQQTLQSRQSSTGLRLERK
ncbi:male-enhanced antigen 1 [Sinocyclocheilus anshuiensis]|uniref:Male-enhanced antigen 1 n=1 Tax=Sinocyclocheilus anshuiensis TaxID=1608454 RepID=A0A671LDX9_9TELE|nr:PREDICTED: male-enhanced antigen 1 [Sinocyclocheilus anshuiensis]XP_016317349.1 PREDICTED: male-enhanced antigen 1 [Sinocyclocheilus anshuiensis]XP_016317350.1 PREDICTED: male-enhanced antigen 1 [Sinocyclocheilus anshuiensis]XP_016317351.1 PREDICTED: male-enhanced antigen 1 [Sinocyclocheilus anshuiensis]